MHSKALSLIAVSALALAPGLAHSLAADPNVHASAEAADRQFLAALENGQPEPVAPVAPSAPATPTAPPAHATRIAKKEAAPPAGKVSVTTPRKAPSVKRENTRPKVATVEIRKAVPVTTSTTTTATTLRSSIGLDEDADERDDNDRDHDRDEDDNRHDGFFDRLFRGEKIFR